MGGSWIVYGSPMYGALFRIPYCHFGSMSDGLICGNSHQDTETPLFGICPYHDSLKLSSSVATQFLLAVLVRCPSVCLLSLVRNIERNPCMLSRPGEGTVDLASYIGDWAGFWHSLHNMYRIRTT